MSKCLSLFGENHDLGSGLLFGDHRRNRQRTWLRRWMQPCFEVSWRYGSGWGVARGRSRPVWRNDTGDLGRSIHWLLRAKPEQHQRNGNEGRGHRRSKGPVTESEPVPRRPIFQARPDVWKQGWRSGRISDDLECLIDRAEQRSLRFVIVPAPGARPLMYHQLSREIGFSGSESIENLFLDLFAIHRNFSASRFLAKNSLDLTVPSGISSIAATS